MPYNSGTGAYERRTTTVIDATPDGDTVAQAIDEKLDTAADDVVTDLNHHKTNAGHYPTPLPVTSLAQILRKSPAGVVTWDDGDWLISRALSASTDAEGQAVIAAGHAADAANTLAACEDVLDDTELVRDDAEANLAATELFINSRYLGAKYTDPSTDNLGNTLTVGSLYYNTDNRKMWVWDGATWQTGVSAGVRTVDGFDGDILTCTNFHNFLAGVI